MRAAIFEGEAMRLDVVDDVEIEDPRAGEVLVAISHCGACHTDLHFLDGTFDGLFPLPIIFGHEASGIVEEVGEGVIAVQPGDQVVLTLCPPCGRCYFCARGEAQLCRNGRVLADTAAFADGSTRISHRGRQVARGMGIAAFAEKAILPVEGVIRVPDDVPLDVVSIIGCAVQTGVGAVLNTAMVEPGATVLVIGLGGVGIAVVQGARIAGASTIIGVDPVAERREQAGAFGATQTLDPEGLDLAQAGPELTDGIGFDYAFDTAAKRATIAGCLHATRAGGTTTLIGVPGLTDALEYPPFLFIGGEKKLQGCYLGSSNPHREFPRLLGLWRAGLLDLEGMVTRRRPLEEVGQAFEDLRKGVGIREVIALA
ncbi:MAG TPA: Zn-dependent alcohol dehydrogenase [Solirubrobacteraceae bacterium]|jgi:Zn-dependent alcohol dehydrogenase